MWNEQAGKAHCVYGEHLPKRVEILEIIKSICALMHPREIMPVSGFDGNECYYETGFVVK